MLQLMEQMESNVAHARNVAYEKKPNAFPLDFDLEKSKANASMAKLKEGESWLSSGSSAT